MDELEWRKKVKKDGYNDIGEIEWPAGMFNDMHAHEFAANIFVLSGQITIDEGQAGKTCNAGDSDSLRQGVQHSELVGPEGVRFLVARKPR